MYQRFALFIATLAAAFVIAVSLVNSTPTAKADPIVATPPAVATPQPTPETQVDTVYVPAPVKPKTITVHRNVAPSAGAGRETESEGGDD